MAEIIPGFQDAKTAYFRMGLDVNSSLLRLAQYKCEAGDRLFEKRKSQRD